MESTSKNKIYTRRITTKNMVITSLMAAIMCIIGPFSIPLPVTLVPISLTNFVIYLAAFVLSYKYCALSYIIYLLLGIIGLPVFSNFGSGIGKVAGPTGGYLVGFILTAIICAFMNEKFSKKIYMSIVGMIIGLAIAYLFGTIWFSIEQNMSFVQSLSLCVVPFLIGDAVKIIVAVIVGPTLRKSIQRFK